MNEEKKDPEKEDVESTPPPPPLVPLHMDPKWARWYVELRVGFADMRAVLEDQLRPPRERDLGVREAMRLFQDAQEKLLSLFAYAERGGDPPSDTPR
jgi:hypothetical protein